MRLLLGWAINALCLLALPWLLPAVKISGIGSALVAALVLGLLNTLIRPMSDQPFARAAAGQGHQRARFEARQAAACEQLVEGTGSRHRHGRVAAVHRPGAQTTSASAASCSA